MSRQCIVNGLMSRQCIVDGLMSGQCIVDGLMSRQCIVDGLMGFSDPEISKRIVNTTRLFFRPDPSVPMTVKRRCPSLYHHSLISMFI
jgi:hypothetical protein